MTSNEIIIIYIFLYIIYTLFLYEHCILVSLERRQFTVLKKDLNRNLPSVKLTYYEIYTKLIQIEACLNPRLLTCSLQIYRSSRFNCLFSKHFFLDSQL